MSCQHDALASYRRANENKGPTQTYTAQRRFGERLRGELASIKADIRTAREKASQDTPPTAPYSGVPPLTAAASGAFMAWLTTRLNSGFLNVVSPSANQFIRRGYAQGVRSANSDLMDVDGVPVPDGGPDVEDTINRPFHRTELNVLYERAYEQLEDVSDDMARGIRQELINGFREGENPTKIARSINDRVDAIGKHRSTLIARTEVMNAHTEGFISRTREMQETTDTTLGIRHVGRLTAMDEDVCTPCRLLADEVFTLDEFQSTRFQYGGQLYTVRPPSHVQGRCAPTVEGGIGELPPLEERVPGTLV